MKFLRFPFHSLILALYPVLNLYVRNMAQIPFPNVYRAALISVMFAGFFLISFKLILRSWPKAGILCSMHLVLFFSYGHVATSLEESARSQILLAVLPWTWLAIYLILTFIVIRSYVPDTATQVLDVASMVLLIVPIASISSTVVAFGYAEATEEMALAKLRGELEAEASIRRQPINEMPDIYYIIFDGYERGDILLQDYGYDSSAFSEDLKERGFYIVERSRSNYLNTNYSLNTSLNLVYYHHFPTPNLLRSKFNLQTNYVSEFLRKMGYQIVVYDSGSNDTNDQYSDVFVTPNPIHLEADPLINPFEILLARTTLARIYFGGSTNPAASTDAIVASINSELNLRRGRITHSFNHLPDYTSDDGPYFLFAHIFLPHFPFLYGAEGEELQYHDDLTLYWYEVRPESYVEFYNYQVDYINKEVLRVIDQIQAQSSRPIVIILQSDHGDDHFMDWDAQTASGVSNRTAILNAIYFSDGDYETLYPTATPVNTFRIVFNHWFGTEYPLLPDRVYSHEHPVRTPMSKVPEFIDSCPEFNLCLPDLSG